MSSWVDSGLDAASATRAPPARRARMNTAVSAVTCRQAATDSPSNGLSALNWSWSAASSGIIRLEYLIRPSPSSASPGTDRYRRGPLGGDGGPSPRGAAAVFIAMPDQYR